MPDYTREVAPASFQQARALHTTPASSALYLPGRSCSWMRSLASDVTIYASRYLGAASEGELGRRDIHKPTSRRIESKLTAYNSVKTIQIAQHRPWILRAGGHWKLLSPSISTSAHRTRLPVPHPEAQPCQLHASQHPRQSSRRSFVAASLLTPCPTDSSPSRVSRHAQPKTPSIPQARGGRLSYLSERHCHLHAIRRLSICRFGILS